MSRSRGFLVDHGKRLCAITVVLLVFGLARPAAPSDEERAALAARYRFEVIELREESRGFERRVRPVHPSYRHIAAWISSVGAAVALNDIDGDGLPNDLCLVDPRNDEVIVAPAPGTGERFAPFVLRPTPLPYDTATMAPMGCLPGDLNEDGRLDLTVYFWGRTPVAYLAAGALVTAGRPSYVPHELSAAIERWYTNAGTLTDIDGDGHTDLVFGNYFPDGARVLDASDTGPPQEMQHSMSRATNGGTKRLLRWVAPASGGQTAVRFEDVSDAIPPLARRGWTLAVGAADLDGDLLPEVYFANDFGPDRLLHNRSTPGHVHFGLMEGRPGLRTPASKVLGRDSFKGMGIDFGDLTGDGRLDICVSNIAAEYALEESHFVFVATGDVRTMHRGAAPFVDRSEDMGLSRGGWGWDCRLADFDNDGTLEVVRATGFVKGNINRWPELHELAMGNDELLRHPRSWPRVLPGDDISGREQNSFLARAGDGRWYDIAREIGIGGAQVTRGVAVADVDADGHVDFAVANQWESSRFYRNRSPQTGTFLGLRLRLPAGDAASRAAIGAIATVHLPAGRTLVGQVDGGNGHSGKRSHDLHFGLGSLAQEASVRVSVRWRDAHGAIRDTTLYLRPGWHTVLLRSDSVEVLPP